MQTTIKRVRSLRANSPLILLFGDKNQVRWKLFSNTEAAHIRSELKREAKTIAINQYKRLVFLQKLEIIESSEAKSLEKARKAGAALFSRCQNAGIKEIGLSGEVNPEIALAFAEGFVLAGYQFLKYRSKREKEAHSVKSLLTDIKGVTEKAVSELNTLNSAVFKARDLVNEPQNFLTATELG
ncbi:MAG: M17 family peptidase N-terminal domain-containing protein, partial [Bacteroidota bacterium]